MADEATPDNEKLIAERLDELRQSAREHEQMNPGQNIGFDPGDDPATRDAVLRLIGENIDQVFARNPDKTVDPEELKRFKQEFRRKAENMRARHQMK